MCDTTVGAYETIEKIKIIIIINNHHHHHDNESTVETRYNKGSRDWQKFVRYNKVIFIYFTITEVRKIIWSVKPRTSLYRGSLYQGSTVAIIMFIIK